jgi:hypothetical protein
VELCKKTLDSHGGLYKGGGVFEFIGVPKNNLGPMYFWCTCTLNSLKLTLPGSVEP